VVFFLETTIVYMAARACLTSIADIRRLMLLMVAMIAVLGLLSIPEAILKQRFLHDAASMITGTWMEIQGDSRFGMLRASSVFSHPILFGLAASALATYAWAFSYGGGRYWRMIGVGIATFFSLSSAAFLVYGRLYDPRSLDRILPRVDLGELD